MSQYSIKRLAFWSGVWLGFVLIFGFIGARLSRSPYDRLVRNGMVTQGRITRKEPDNHQNVHYSYVVGSGTYSGVGHGGRAGIPRFELLKIGQKVQVHYDRDNPTISSLGDPALHLRTANGLTISIALTFSPFTTIVLWWETRPGEKEST